ncbi:bacteriophage protein [Mycobacteroides abscessus subsp. bolletii]|uniref:Bacteriophage protein n=1 Tax=Mycobacteroides abscessus subsp. bolletii TaxID=319705 RepID=A0A9Q7SEQ8_9MYCO|nr:hypothetical protein [Mycobacteroides abscessus]SHT85522.1 bacteriophage protein [Mycobacteroides abscessus subsp. bolletii]SHU02326.1 bacteriophage protein [Mycobacteroides abscessus subsp. bolletii]SHX42963.1 bacteriophage protein [Mycobacteroides abscessus subsp. bolletii]SKM64759.1 bacteriophage protein [Mycobacteroides abscessus subsp. bolletii]SKN38960.1 bacteriophage protein [Mycobacteroides abscessus subsp. bolletii]
MTLCRKCYQPAHLFLCPRCTEQLRENLDQLAWFVERLDETVTRQDTLTLGSIGQSSEEPMPFNLTASSLAHSARNTITTWVRTVCEHHGIEFGPVRVVSLDFIGPLPDSRWRRLPRRYTPTLPDMCEWLAEHVQAIALTPGAEECADEMEQLREQIIKAINRNERRFAGPCPTIKGHNQRGEQIHCDEMLYAEADEQFVECPRCKSKIDVDKNRLRSAVNRDLMPEAKLLEILESLGEKVPRVKLYEWIRTKRLHIRGWIHAGRIVNTRIRRGDPRVFSLSQARQLRWKDEAERDASRLSLPRGTTAQGTTPTRK